MTDIERAEINRRIALKYALTWSEDHQAHTPLGVFKIVPGVLKTGNHYWNVGAKGDPVPYPSVEAAKAAAQEYYRSTQAMIDCESLIHDRVPAEPTLEHLGPLEGIQKDLYVGTCTTKPNGIVIAPSASTMTMIWDLFTAISPTVTVSEASSLWIGIKLIEEYQRRNTT